MRYLVIAAHASSYADPLRARARTSLLCEQSERSEQADQDDRHESEWPGWIWCTGPQGRSGWVPVSWLRSEADTCTLLRDYDAVELSISEGEILTGSVVAEGWLWATNGHGQRGWVPLDCLEEAG